MPEITIAYETYGTLAPDGRNAVLLTHGYTSSQHMAGRAGANGAEGSWDGLVGPGKAIDTDRLFVVSSNMLGSSYGSTNPAFTNPATGKPYGPDFPDITLVDIVNAQKALLDHLGVKHLVAVAGPSFGGYQTYQWGVTYPDFMDGLVAVVSAPKGSGGEAAVKSLVDFLAKDPNWNGGWYYDKGGVTGILTEMRVATLKRYGIDEQLAAKFPDKDAREAEIKKRAESWSKVFDANSLVVLRKARCASTPRRTCRRSRPRCFTCCRAPTSCSRPRSRPTSWPSSRRPASAPTISRSTATSATPRRASTPRSGRRG